MLRVVTEVGTVPIGGIRACPVMQVKGAFVIMQGHAYLPGEVYRATGLPIGRYAVVGLVLLCVVLIGYLAVDSVRNVWLVNEAFPSLPSGFATELDAALVFSPLMLHLDSMENGLLRFMQYRF